MKGIIKDILVEQRQRFTSPQHARNTKIDAQLPKVQTITGPRRAGKSSILQLTIAQLLENGIGWDRICYLSLEDERLRSQLFEGDLILQAYRELYPDNPLMKDVYFLFDEVQYLDRWEPFINRVHEQISRHVIITGSNSKTLHTNVASVLRGRGIAVEVLPLSFSEYLIFREIPFAEIGKDSVIVRTAFNDFLQEGGYPETVNLDAQYRQQVLQEYFNAVLYRDIIDQHQPANFSYLRYLFHRIANNTGKQMAISKIFQELKSRGYSVSKNSLYDMTSLAEDVYLFKRISKYDPSLIRRENADKKGYFIDNGLLHAIDGSFSGNKGMLLENLVFWQLYRQYGNLYTTDLYYFRDASHECDFILYKEGGKALPIQACYRMDSNETRDRELKGLVKACDQTDSKIGVIITLEQEEVLNFKEKQIFLIPAWKWCGKPFDLFTLHSSLS